MLVGMYTVAELEARITELRQKLMYRELCVYAGRSDRSIGADVRRGVWVRVVHGAYMLRVQWDELREEDRLLARTLAVARMNRGRTMLFSHHSAAVVWGFPLYRFRAGPVHVLASYASPGKSSGRVTRHLGECAEDEIRQVAGLFVTAPARTLVDLARSETPEVAVGCADAAVRAILNARRDAPRRAIEEWRAAQLDGLEPLRGRPGMRRARRVVAFADPRADTVVESVSRLQLARLGIRTEIQVPVHALNGVTYWVDFEFCEQGIFGEVDGAVKYVDGAGRAARQALIREKERQDQVCGVARKRMVRWMPSEISTAQRLGRRLLDFGVRVPMFEV